MALEQHRRQMEVPRRGQYIRAIIAELERLHSHFLWAGNRVPHASDTTRMFMHIWNEREVIMDVLELLTGNRVNYAMNTVGGARRDIDDGKRQKVIDMLEGLTPALSRIHELFATDKTLAMRTKNVGVLTREDAVRLGRRSARTPGPRASICDVRREAPYSCYDEFCLRRPRGRRGGCVCARGDPHFGML